jgi:RNA polymerase sigma factor (TIGR02999 family)
MRKTTGNNVMPSLSSQMHAEEQSVHGLSTAGSQSQDPGGEKAVRETLSVEALFSATYEELRRIARYLKRQENGLTLNPTALVDEAWLKLAGSSGTEFESHLHFKRIAARAMRQILVDAARRRNSRKRGSGEAVMITLTDMAQPVSCDRQFLALHEALDELALLSPRQALLVESRFFGGLDVGETAALLEVSEATVLRDWRVAKAWLAIEIRRRT